jgi:hypothetical protein
MPARIDIHGLSFTAIPLADAARHDVPCVYLMTSEEQGVHHIHYAGQTHCLCDRFATHHRINEAITRGATHALVLIVRDARIRLALETVLRWSLRPPMNAEDVPTHMQAWRAAQACGLHDIATHARTAHLSGARAMLPPWTRTPAACVKRIQTSSSPARGRGHAQGVSTRTDRVGDDS